MTVGIFWYGLSPKSRMILGGTLAEPRFDKTRLKIEFAIRICVVVFGLLVLFYKAVPLGSDLFSSIDW